MRPQNTSFFAGFCKFTIERRHVGSKLIHLSHLWLSGDFVLESHSLRFIVHRHIYTLNNVYCRICLRLAIITPCIKVFSPDGEFGPEAEEIKELRTKSRKAFFDTQVPMLQFWFRSLWSIAMLLVLSGGIVCIMLEVISNHRQASNIEKAIACLNGIFILTWLILSILNFVCYRPSNYNISRSQNKYFSYFSMEQLQQFWSELSLYPQLCFAATQLSVSHDVSYVLVGLFIFSSLMLLVVFSLRIYAIIKIRVFVRSFLVRLLFSIMSNYMSVVLLVVLLLWTSSVPDLILQLLLFGLVLITNIWNLFMFYLSHLYEITLQSGVNIVQLLDASEGRNALRVIREMQNLETFHKNMYPLSKPGTGTLLYFWITPSVAVTIYTVIAYLDNLSVLIPVVAWFFFNAAINYKTLLLSCSAHFTSFVILIFFTAVCMLSGAIAFMMYGLIVVIYALLYSGICCICIYVLCCPQDRVEAGDRDSVTSW